jgi:alcohol dehydrogenase (cytochrome c)
MSPGDIKVGTVGRIGMRRLLCSVAMTALAVSGALSVARAADMSFERALNADSEPQNWLLHHKNYQGHRFSALKEIDTATVGNLRLAFTVGLGGLQSGGRYAQGNLEATPLVDNGMMYIPDGWGSVYAIDVSSGKKAQIKWKFDPGVDRAWAGDVACCGVNNRGVALWKDKVISIALDGRIFAIDRATGEEIWERKTAEPALGETVTLAPLVIRDLAIIGSAGGEFGIRGWIDATDLNTGKQAWRTFTIPGAGEPGNESWKDGKEHWKHGGASVWVTATYDPETETIYQGIGNAGPDYDPEYRPGDNKWAASVLALDPNNGKIKWGFQYTPNDPYDYDEISEHQIINRMFAEELPPGAINVVTGLPSEIGDALTTHPDVRKIGFTGSIPSARHIMSNAAQSIKGVTLELGGTSDGKATESQRLFRRHQETGIAQDCVGGGRSLS